MRAAPADTLPAGLLIDNRFEITGRLGAGGFGVVYAARQLSTGQAVAIKVMTDATEMDDRTRFEREMRVIARLQHPNIVRLLDFGALPDGRLFTVLVFVEGQDLAGYLKKRGALPTADAVDLMRQVLDALHHAHRIGIVHRDLKPANIMVLHAGMRPHVLVLDFGIAGVIEGTRGPEYVSLTTQSGVVGTPTYMAPEQLKGQLNPATDLYAWGLVLLECLTGTVTVEASTPMAAMAAQLSPEPVPIPADIADTPLGALILEVVEKDVDRRLPTASDALQRLDALAPPPPRTRWIAAVIAAAIVGVALGLILMPTPKPIVREVPVMQSPQSAAPAAPSTAWITDRLEAWRLAWERTAPRGEVDALAQFYAPSFTDDGQDLDAWLARKREHGLARGWVRLTVSDVAARRDGARLVVELQQRYRSPLFNDAGKKTLVWAQTDGVWRIVSEAFEEASP